MKVGDAVHYKQEIVVDNCNYQFDFEPMLFKSFISLEGFVKEIKKKTVVIQNYFSGTLVEVPHHRVFLGNAPTGRVR